MSNYYFAPFGQGHGTDSDARVQNWMLAQMAQYPPPPQADHHHYNALYPASAGAQQLVDPQDQLQYSNLNQPVYPKVDSAGQEQGLPPNQGINHLAQELQPNATFDEQQQRQSLQHGGQQMHPQLAQAQPAATPGPSQASTQQTNSDSQKSNRLRKACDSCSIRKVKVRRSRLGTDRECIVLMNAVR